MDEPGLSRATRRTMTVWNVIQFFRKPNGRMGFVPVLISVAALLSVPGLLCGQERQTDLKDETYLLLNDESIHNAPLPSNGLLVRGTVSSSNVFRPSGNVDLDESVKTLANRVSRVEPLPDGLGKGDHYDVKINFELNSE